MSFDAESEDGDDEVITLIHSGDSEQRIDLTFMGDGYTEAEKEKFFQDIERMVDDMFKGQTFASYLPLFNVHAVFRPSRESGIGRNNRPKDTAYRLYRAGMTLRAIYPGNTAALRHSCAKAPGCDYPIVIANDPYYGGLGGEFAISTSSKTSGTVVLRHELGHNFGRVGEEYDGGGYFGANHTSSVVNPSWQHWLSDEPKEQPSIAKYINWPWKNLEKGPFVANWRSDGKYAYSLIQYSASGMDQHDSLRIDLNGKSLPFHSSGTADREFYSLFNEQSGFLSGSHKLTFKRGLEEGNHWLSSLSVYEYGEDYVFDRHHVSLYPLYSRSLAKQGYRPTDRTCLMRNMKSEIFCRICQENNWLQFLSKVSLIDEIKVTKNDNVSIELALVKLGQLRDDDRLSTKGKLAITWYKDGQKIPELDDTLIWTMDKENAKGRWRVEVHFLTAEVRKDPDNLLSDTKMFSI